MIKIDDNVPMPRPKHKSKYPLGELNVGQSFFLPGGTQATISGSLYLHKPKRFATRTVTEKGVKGVRVWRVE